MFTRDGVLYRQVNQSYAESWSYLTGSGLLDELQRDELLVRHREVPTTLGFDSRAWRVIQPDPIPFISYPYEWGPTQLQAAALHTLAVLRKALERGLILKDASAFNIQFIGSRPVFVDTLSFEAYRAGEPWVGYRQFCQHFLAPLALMRGCDPRARDLLRGHIDGIPLDLASSLLPMRSRFRPVELIHIHMHSRSIRQHAGTGSESKQPAPRMELRRLSTLLDHLESGIRSLTFSGGPTTWSGYEDDNSYLPEGLSVKEDVVRRRAARCGSGLVIDLGANTGRFSRIATDCGMYAVAIDGDVGAVERLTGRAVKEDNRTVLPLWVDLVNPSPALGWLHRERDALLDRRRADLVLALALVHHICIGNNVPLPQFFEMIHRTGRGAIVEWIPKQDQQVQRLLRSRTDVFATYDEASFTDAASSHFRIVERIPVPGQERVLYVLEER